MAAYDGNLFYDAQLYNSNISWQLFGQPQSLSGGNMEEYSTIPLLRGILSDTELGFSVAHDFGSSDLLGGAEGFAGQVVGIADKLSEATALGKAIGKSTFSILGQDVGPDQITKLIGRMSKRGGDIFGAATAYAGSRFTTAFDFVKVFKGTGLEIEIPALETRIYHKVINKKPVELVVKDLIDKFVGDLVSTSLDDVDNVLGIQAPPNGYVPEFRVISGDHHVPGSFCLKYGPYTIDNLLVTSFSYRLSTVRVREMSSDAKVFDFDNIKAGATSLYADVRVGLQPCTYISKNTLMKIMGAKALESSSADKENGSMQKIPLPNGGSFSVPKLPDLPKKK